MAEDKAEKALRKVIINLTNRPANVVCSEDDLVQIDITEQFPEEGYHLAGITVDRGEGNRHTIEFVEADWLRGIVNDIDTVLDATLVNAKQRESVGQLIRQCVWKERGHWMM